MDQHTVMQTPHHMKTLANLLWGRRWELLRFLLFTTVSTSCLVLAPFWGRALTGLILENPDPERLTHHVALGAVLLVLILYTTFKRDYASFKLSNEAGGEIRSELFNKCLFLPYRSYQHHRLGDMITRLSSDTDILCEGLHSGLLVLVPNLLVVFALMMVMLVHSWLLTVGTLLILSPMGLVLHFTGNRIRERTKTAQARTSRLNGALEEMLRGVKEIKSYGREAMVEERFGNLNRQTVDAFNSRDKWRALNPAVVSCVTFASIGILALGSGAMVFSHKLAIENLSVVFSGLLLIIHPVDEISRAFGYLGKAYGAMDRIDELLETESETVNDVSLPPFPPVEGHIRFNQVNFAYGTAFRLSNLVFEASPGEILAIVGPSGAGKSTLVGLLLRFLEPDSGSILVDGRDISQFQIAGLRSQIGYVPQEPVLFDASLAENIAFSKPGADHEEVLAATRAAHVDEFARKLPQGYDSSVGPFGILLSSGQRQRIALARAFLTQCPILILDEPTSALDPESDQLIRRSLSALRKRRTVFIIAHRMSTTREADRILVLEEGRIVEQGRHAELLERDGLYRRYCALSSSDSKPLHV